MRARHLVAGLMIAAGIGAVALVPAIGPASSAESLFTAETLRIATPAKPVVHMFQGYAGKCIDIPGGIPVDKVALQLYTCNHTAAQIFTGTNRGEALALGMCLSVAGDINSNGSAIVLADCSGGPRQKWFVDNGNGAPGRLWNQSSGKCVDVKDWNDADGASLQLWDCVPGQANQQWALVAP